MARRFRCGALCRVIAARCTIKAGGERSRMSIQQEDAAQAAVDHRFKYRHARPTGDERERNTRSPETFDTLISGHLCEV